MSYAAMEINHSDKGYYVLKVGGVFIGNYDTIAEAIADYEEIEQEERICVG